MEVQGAPRPAAPGNDGWNPSRASGRRVQGDGTTDDQLSLMLMSLGCIFLAALVFDAIGRHTRLPRVTLLLVFGFATGPSCLDALPEITGAWFPAVADIALLMIGFLLGGRLTNSELREHGRQVIGFSIVVVGVTFLVVALGLFAIGVTPVVALVASQRFPEAGDFVLPVVITGTVFFELLGPIATRFALDRTAAGDGH